MNIVLLIADTLRNREIKEGEIDFLNDLQDKLSLDYYSNASWTVPAHATMFTGKLPSEHGVNSTNPFFDQENELLDKLAQEGFYNVAVSENKLFSQVTGYAEEFDEFVNTNEDTWEGETWQNFVSHNKSGIVDYAKFFSQAISTGDIRSLQSAYRYLKRKKTQEDFNPTYTDYTIQKAINFLKSKEDTFLVTNLMPTHLPYTFTSDERREILEEMSEEKINELSKGGASDIYGLDLSEKDVKNKKQIYKASASYLEKKIYEFVHRAPEETIFIILGDHGELLGEYEKDGRKLLGHHFGTFKELVEVPFYIYPSPENISVKGLVDHTQLKDIVTGIAKQEETEVGKNVVRSEYFSKAGFDREFLDKDTEKRIFKRKSFSIIDNDYKFDIASEGKFLWNAEDTTEDKSLDVKNVPDKMKTIADIHYNWRLKDED